MWSKRAGKAQEKLAVREGERPREPNLLGQPAEIRARGDARPPGTMDKHRLLA